MRKAISVLCLGLCSLPLHLTAQSRKVKKLENQRKEVLQKIENTNKALQKVKKSGQEEKKRLQLVREQVAQRKEVIAVIGHEMQELQGQIDSLGGQISRLRSKEARLLEQYAASIRALQRKKEGRSQMIYLLSSRSVDEAILRQRFLSQYALSASQIAKELKQTRSSIEHTQREVNTIHQQKAEVLAIRDRERKALEVEEGQRSANINNLKGQEKKLSQDLVKQRRQAAQLDAQIQAQIQAEIAAAEAKARREQEARERRRNRRRAGSKTSDESRGGRVETEQLGEKATEREDEGTNRQPAIRGGYAMDADERRLSGSFSQNRGRLPMPVHGRYDLVRRFGVQQDQKVSISNGGIDIRVHSDRNAYSVFEGVVSRIFFTAGYGQSVIVRHGNYLTVYANLSSVRVSMGQRVSTGFVIGTISSDDGDGRANTLHFQLWHERSKQNPELWIRR